ncbi:phosphotransferase family protein [Shouchella patagoniensis]|uniref:phosphotransferase family protein n=1 Tax=Shouchella patagoniensis TaxID=228576 RepID=UPI00099543A7|nr:phosphotransferase [Shouchella patagoniensis]
MRPFAINEIPNDIKHFVGRIDRIRFPRQGYTSDVGIIEAKGHYFALKRTREPLYCSWLEQEVDILSLLSIKTTLPVPDVEVYVKEDEKGHSWALMECLQGETMRFAIANESNQKRREELIVQFGEILARVHSIPCPNEWKQQGSWLDNQLKKASYQLTHYQVDVTSELLKEIVENRPQPVKQTLIHGDFTIDNVLVHNRKISGVIDWAGGAYGDPRYDVALAVRPKPSLFQKNTDYTLFFNGYGAEPISKEDYHYFANGLNEFF